MPLSTIFKKLFGSRNQRQLNKLNKVVAEINSFEPELQKLSDQELAAKTQELKSRLQQGDTLEKIAALAFAVVRESARRTLNMRHFDVQLLGGLVMHYGNIAEMHTGEGKTLVATLPAYLNALSGKGVHIITVNDYLAKRDADWMRPIFEFLGLKVGVITSYLSKEERKEAYAADITYGTNNEFGFDYLRDNMAFSLEEKAQRGHNFAIIDEVDSILIDEARTPLIISGPSEDSSILYKKINEIVPQLIRQETEEAPGDYYVDEKSKQVFLSEQGHETVEDLLVKNKLIAEDESLYAPSNISLMHHINAALRAHAVFHRDVDYIVSNDEVIIVDEHTGRTMIGRRWSDGLHQAIEAKEHVKIQNENQTLASITFQNYFRIYQKIAGMTGTADTEAYEFQQIYNLEVLVIPTNRKNQRIDEQDLVFLTAEEKFTAIIEDIKQAVDKKQPVLLGTASIETSEYLSLLLKKANILHQVLNAKFHEYEAQIIAEAGRPGAVTIATNMAGRGTDIVLGGNLDAEIDALSDNYDEEELEKLKLDWQLRHDTVIAAGGLYVIASERHESRRIDNQLRGRSGRQGDPGLTKFYLSLDDDLMRLFAKPGIVAFMRKLHTEKGVPLQSNLISRGIENAQRKVEGQNFDIRKQLLEFDDVANEQRKVIYGQRDELLSCEDISSSIHSILNDVILALVSIYIPENSVDEVWDIPGLKSQLKKDFNVELDLTSWIAKQNVLTTSDIVNYVFNTLKQALVDKEQRLGQEIFSQLGKLIMLQSLDQHWKEHLANMDHLRQSVNLRGYAQKDPKQEYKREAFNLFSDMLDTMKQNIISIIFRAEVANSSQVEAMEAEQEEKHEQSLQNLQYNHAEAKESKSNPSSQQDNVLPFIRKAPKVGRNDLCFCNSGKKYKHCHGKLT